MHLVKPACERPELARQLVDEGLVSSISPQTVRRILSSHKLKPWRIHYWLSPDKPRDGEFYATVQHLIELYTRPLAEDEVALSIDEKTALQPRPRKTPTKPAREGNQPNRVGNEYKRDGALQLFAAFDTRSGRVYGQTFERKRQVEFIAFGDGQGAAGIGCLIMSL